MAEPNWSDKTIWTGDCLDIMRGMNAETVDLIYLDPPFNSNTDYAAPIGSQAAGAAFKDTWSLSDVDAEWINLIETKHPGLHRVLLAAMSDSDKAYLAYMAARLLEMPRILKPTGSIYLHCDPTMSHYLKLLMDAIFGRDRFKNDLVWKRTSSHSAARRFASVSDRLLFYAFDGATWNPQHLPLGEAYVARDYRHTDDRGRFRFGDLTGSGLRDGESSQPWQGYDPSAASRHWAVPIIGNYARWIDVNLIPGYRTIASGHARLDALAEAGLIDWTSQGYPRLKRYLEASQGEAVSDFIGDIQNINNRSRERTGYPTQKPLALLNRTIEASSNPGDIVFDPFCGCATACVAADLLGRRWVGIDISPKAVELVNRRLQEPPPLGIGPMFHHGYVTVRDDIPQRTDLGPLPAPRSHRATLYGLQEGNCTGCNVHFEARHLEVDHIIARAKGGTDHVDNLQLLCGSCNRIKGDRGMEYLRVKLQLR